MGNLVGGVARDPVLAEEDHRRVFDPNPVEVGHNGDPANRGQLPVSLLLQWHVSFYARLIENLKNTPDSLPTILEKDSVELFTKYKVYNKRELESRFAILAENYVKTVTIEGKCASLMARTMILPAALRYQAEVARASNRTARVLIAGSPCGSEVNTLILRRIPC